MRLVDADKLVDDNKEIIDCEIDHPIYQNTVREILDAQPTIEPKTGRWVEHGVAKGSEMCDQCGFVQLKHRVHNYCPYCGAKMEEHDEIDRC